MRIGLLDIDGKNFPNLALMKISAFHKSKGDSVEFVNHLFRYDRIYKSKVFSYTGDDNTVLMADEIIEGGTGYNLTYKLSDEIEHILPDYDLYNTDHAYGFLTRGCIRNCSWCIVPRKEGKIRPHAEIKEFIGDKKSAILMDNNVLASNWGLSQIEKISEMKIKIDFNQGLDSRIIAKNQDIADLLSGLKWIRFVRMACDKKSQIPSLLDAANRLRKKRPKIQIFVYVLVKNISDALERVKIIDENNMMPFAQPYRDFNGNEPEKILKVFSRWVNRRQLFKSVSWDKYLENIRTS